MSWIDSSHQVSSAYLQLSLKQRSRPSVLINVDFTSENDTSLPLGTQ